MPSGPDSGSGVPRPVDVTISNDTAINESELDAPATEDSIGSLLGKVARAPASGPPPADLGPGTLIDGTFKITRLLGAGGMGVVYLARDLDLQRDVAVKVHRAATGLDRLQREAVAMAQLAHPNVLTVHAVGTLDRRLYIAMEYVPGLTFRAWREVERPGWRKVLAMLVAAGEGLAAAHDAGFVHRDFKPENILVGRDGRPRVGDFGLVRAAGDGVTTSGVLAGLADAAGNTDAHATLPDHPSSEPAALAETMEADSASATGRRPRSPSAGPTQGTNPSPLGTPLTVTGAALGTPAYMAPEQFVGGDVDARADQFAFSIVLYEALCGRRPWPGATYPELRDQVTRRDPDPLPRGAAPGWLARVIRRGLSRDPADRYPDLRALLAALHAGPRRRARLALAAAALVLAAGGAAALALRPSHGMAPAPSCDHAAAALDEIWSPAVAKDLSARLAALDAEVGPRKAELAVGRFDRWAARFRTVADQACRAERIDHVWSARTGAQSRVCLGAALRVTREAIRLTVRVESTRLATFANDLAVLPQVEECASERALLATYQVPADAAAAAEVRRMREVIHDIDALRDGGDLPGARARFAAAWPTVEALHFDPLTAQYLSLDGELLREERKLDEAIARFERAWAIGRAAGADAVALAAVYWLIWVHAADKHDPAAARPWVVQAVPEAERYGLEHGPALSVLQAAAVVAEIEADYERAVELHRRLVDAIGATEDVLLAKALGNLGAALDGSGRSAEAVEAYQRALGIFERELGADAPTLLWVRSNLVLAQIATGDVEGGLATAEAAMALYQVGPGIDAQEILNLAFNHAFALERAGRKADAEAAYRALRAQQVALTGEDSIDVAYLDANLGDLYVQLGRHDDARRHLEAALRIREKLLGEDHDEVADVRTNLGRLERDTRGCARAVPHYQAAVRAFRTIAARGTTLARGSRAFVGLAACRRGDAARELLEEGRRFAEAGDPEMVAEIDRLLAASP